MVKKTVSAENFTVVKKYIEIGKKYRKLEKERKELLKTILPEGISEEVISVSVRGERGIAFVVERTTSEKVNYRGIVENDYPDEKDLEKIKTKNSNAYNTVKVKL